LVTNWLRKFPRGEFSFNARGVHELRDPVSLLFDATDASAVVVRTTLRAQVVTGVIEIRIQRATLFYQIRNLTGAVSEQIPGIALPQAVQVYGVRWEFWN